MNPYCEMTEAELVCELSTLKEEYAEFKSRKLSLDMSRGKPGKDQLEISMELLDCVCAMDALLAEDETDCRNYGVLNGLQEMRRLVAEVMGVSPELVLIGGNSSLNLMYDTIARAFTHGEINSEKPWGSCDCVKFLCPSPGYDRHFKITEHFGVEMIPIAMGIDGPDMDEVESLLSKDPAIKGIWCVPKYSNPTGVTYSDAVVRRMASLKPAAPDFRIFWDDAYCVHDLYDEGDSLLNIMEACKDNGTEDSVYIFVSTSKITFPGAGVAAMAASPRNMKNILDNVGVQTIGSDKLNQLRHSRYLKDAAGVRVHMRRHAALLRPKFEAVLTALHENLAGTGLGSWQEPRGGYFISFDAPAGCAQKIYSLCKEAGVKLTEAGATFPYGKDPEDKNLRLAPTYPCVGELQQAAELFCLCVKIAGAQKLLEANL